MVFVNYTAMQVTAKIVYYGPGLGGKTTNLAWIHQKTAPGSRGEMVSLETETDRTLFFDLLPLDVGVIGGMKVRLQLYTVPGQVFYNATRRLVLKGVDGIVFVADSQEAAEDANVESFTNLKANLSELSLSLEQIPVVFQFNKRDIRNITPVEKMQAVINPNGGLSFEAAALHGVGVFETLKAISRLALESIRKKIAEERKAPALARAAAPVAAKVGAGAAKTARGEDPMAGLVVDEPGTGEVKVEFAEEDTDKHAVRPVRTKGEVDLHEELEKLRAALAAGGKLAVVADKNADRLFKDLVLAAKDRRQEVRRKAGLALPKAVLQSPSKVHVRLAFEQDGKEEVVKDALTIDLDGNRHLERVTLYLDVDLKGKG